MLSAPSKKVKSVDTSPSDDDKDSEKISSIPQVNINDPSSIESQGVLNKKIPQVDSNASLKIEEITKAPLPPIINKDSPLEYEKERLETVENPGKKIFYFGVAFLIIIFFVLVLFISLYPSLEKKRSQVVTTDLEIFPSPEVSKFERGDWSLEILNGSGIPGLAKEVADKLTDSGYEVAKTGNAPDGNYQGNQVFINKNFLNKKDQFM